MEKLPPLWARTTQDFGFHHSLHTQRFTGAEQGQVSSFSILAKEFSGLTEMAFLTCHFLILTCSCPPSHSQSLLLSSQIKLFQWTDCTSQCNLNLISPKLWSLFLSFFLPGMCTLYSSNDIETVLLCVSCWCLLSLMRHWFLTCQWNARKKTLCLVVKLMQWARQQEGEEKMCPCRRFLQKLL